MTVTGPTDLDPDGKRPHAAWVPRPRPLGSLLASAQRITTKQMSDRTGFGKPEAWQEDAWDMYDLVGEEHFLAATLSGRLSQAKLYVGRMPEDPIEQPEPLDSDEHVAARAFAFFGQGAFVRSQVLMRLGVNLFVAGDGWLVGIPRHLLPGYEGEQPSDEDPMLSLEDLDWRMLSVSEVASEPGNQRRVVLTLGEDSQRDRITVSPDAIFLIRVWRPHPRKAWQADSPTRASLPVLRELVGLTMHISAQVDSRLAGAGLLIVPESARAAVAIAAGVDPESDEDPFTDALIEAMLTPIQDRGSASAVVPLVVTVPDASANLFQYMTFAKPLDTEARNLRDEAIRRLALGQDAPPELLLGTSGMNHWGAWLVREDVVTTHIEPPLALICDAITTQFLQPILIEQGMDEGEARQYVVWYDVSHMIQRPNRLADAVTLHDKGALSDESLREAAGFNNDSDKPPENNRSVEMAITMAQANPALVDNLKEIIAAFDEVLNPTATEKVEIATTQAPDEGESVVDEETGPPADDTAATDNRTKVAPDQPDDMAASGVVEAFLATPNGKAFIEGFIEKFGMVRGQTFAKGDTSTSVVIVALPSADDPVQSIGEEEKHATLVYLGSIGDTASADLEASKQAVLDAVTAAAQSLPPFAARVQDVNSLGNEGAVVWILADDGGLTDLNTDLMADPVVAPLYEAGTFEKYDSFTPHVTIGYADDSANSADTVEQARAVEEITFDRLAVWWGDEQVEFPLGGTAPTPTDEEPGVEEGTAEFEQAALEGFLSNPVAQDYARGRSLSSKRDAMRERIIDNGGQRG